MVLLLQLRAKTIIEIPYEILGEPHSIGLSEAPDLNPLELRWDVLCGEISNQEPNTHQE